MGRAGSCALSLYRKRYRVLACLERHGRIDTALNGLQGNVLFACGVVLGKVLINRFELYPSAATLKSESPGTVT
jgi:hypothetical protein